MLKTLCEFLRDNVRLELFMSVVLLTAVTSIACNMDKVAERENESAWEKKTNGKTVVIDPGHGGKDPGKVGVNDAREKDVNLAISNVLCRTLTDRGFSVVMTRTEDVSPGGEAAFSKVKDLNARCEIINNTYMTNKDCVMVSIHQNSYTQESVHGAQCFYYQRSDESRRLAGILQDNLNSQINTEKPKDAKPNDTYYMLINSKCPGVILECGFLSNSEEADKLIDGVYQQKIADMITKSLTEYFQVE